MRIVKILLILLSGPIALLPLNVSAQNASASKLVRVKFANTDSVHIPLKQILANPVLTTKPGCEVTEFTISLLPAGGEFQGPYKTPGSRVRENQLSYLKEFTNMNVRIFIENIRLKCDGAEVQGQNFVCISVPK